MSKTNPTFQRLRTVSLAALMLGVPLVVVTLHARAADPAPTVTPVPLPAGAAAAFARIMQQLSPARRSAVHPLGLRLNDALKTQPLADPEAVATSYVTQSFPGLSSMDIESLVLIVIMDATNAQENEMQTIMNEIQAQNNAKQQLRNQMNAVNRDVAANGSAMQSRLDSLNELSEMTSLRLQMAMDRRSKFVTALSNVLKKISSTGETIIQNVK